MNRQDVKGTFARYGDFVSVTQVAECLGIDRGTARSLLYGLAYIPIGRKKLYHISDIADRIMERRTNG